MGKIVAKLITGLIDSLPALLIVLGVMLFTLGLAGGVTYQNWFPFPDMGARIAAGLAGGIAVGLGVLVGRQPGRIPRAADYGFTIDHPVDNDEVDAPDIRGRLKKAPPPHFVVMIVRGHPDESFMPLKPAAVDPEKGTWEAVACDIGGSTGDPRTLRVYLVGRDGAALFAYYSAAARVHGRVLKELPATVERTYLPLIKEPTSDMVECARVKLRRK